MEAVEAKGAGHGRKILGGGTGHHLSCLAEVIIILATRPPTAPGIGSDPPIYDSMPRLHEAKLTDAALRALGVSRQPLASRPAPEEYFSDTQIEDDLHMLRRNARNNSELAQLISGSPGSGKTALLLKLLRKIENEFIIFAVAPSPGLDGDKLIVDMLRVYQEPEGKVEDCLKLLVRHLHAGIRDGAKFFVAIDDLHHLSTRNRHSILQQLAKINQRLIEPIRLVITVDESSLNQIAESVKETFPLREIGFIELKGADMTRMRAYLLHRFKQSGMGLPQLPLNGVALTQILQRSGGNYNAINRETAAIINANHGLNYLLLGFGSLKRWFFYLFILFALTNLLALGLHVLLLGEGIPLSQILPIDLGIDLGIGKSP